MGRRAWSNDRPGVAPHLTSHLKMTDLLRGCDEKQRDDTERKKNNMAINRVDFQSCCDLKSLMEKNINIPSRGKTDGTSV